MCIAALPGVAKASGDDLLGADVGTVYRSHPHDPARVTGRPDDLAILCDRLAAARWGADYAAGIDAAGNPVAPADLPSSGGSDWAPVASFDLPLRRDGGRRRSADVTVGTVEVDTGSGVVTIDGQPINRSEAGRLRILCGRR